MNLYHKARALARALCLSGGDQTGSEKAQYPNGNLLPEQWGSGFDMKVITGGLNSLIMTAGYHAFGGEGFANDYSKMNWNNMTYSAYDLGSFLGSEASGFIKDYATNKTGKMAELRNNTENARLDGTTPSYEPGIVDTVISGMAALIKTSEAGEHVVKGIFQGIGAGIVSGVAGLGESSINLARYGVFGLNDSAEVRRARDIELSKMMWESGEMEKLIAESKRPMDEHNGARVVRTIEYGGSDAFIEFKDGSKAYDVKGVVKIVEGYFPRKPEQWEEMKDFTNKEHYDGNDNKRKVDLNRKESSDLHWYGPNAPFRVDDVVVGEKIWGSRVTITILDDSSNAKGTIDMIHFTEINKDIFEGKGKIFEPGTYLGATTSKIGLSTGPHLHITIKNNYTRKDLYNWMRGK